MSWFQSTNLASFAKTALKEAQKTIDKALDIKEEGDGGGANSNNSSRTSAAVSSTVTDMASDFFASWGVVGGSTPTKISTTSDSGSSAQDGVYSNTDTTAPAISSPPKRCSTMDELLLVDQQHAKRNSLANDIPVTLLVSSISFQDHTEIDDQQNEISSTGSSCKHTRSLSDTVFHASDESHISNPDHFVQVLDSSCPVDVSSSQDPVSFMQMEPDMYSQNKSNTSGGETSVRSVTPNCSTVNASGENTEKVNSISAEIPIAIKDNIDLLQEIDLDGETCVGETSKQTEVESNNVIHSTDPNIVESSQLSDGWDWTSATESCLMVVGESDAPENLSESHKQMDTPVVDGEIKSVKKDEPLCASENLKPKPGTEVEKQHSENVPSTSSFIETTSSPLLNSTVPLKIVPCPSSRAPSPSTQISERDGRESMPVSPTRISPNLEIVPGGCCVVNGSGIRSNLPGSSRSSSIVVVSDRESTMNSRGTSGAGSSGSSEGGHDLVDGEVSVQQPQSPAVVPSCEYTGNSKHRKGASSSSSSDIEVIPLDYSSSSSAPPHQHTSDERNRDMGCQTEPYGKDCEVQTDENQSEPLVKSIEVTPKELSKYVSSEVTDLLAEKEAEVQQLREEGEKLSIKQFELGQVIKKLRVKEKETDGVVKGLRTEIATKNLELEKLMKTFISKEGIEQSQNETISKLNQERRKLELKVEQLNSELEDAKDNVESMKATVENTSIEILELKNVISSVQRDSAEVDRLTREKGELINRTEALQKEVDHLRSALNTCQTSHHSRESELKFQISDMTLKCHQLETQLADISSEVADATMPLSLEIEKLQGELKQQVTQADRREQTLHSTITDLELKLKIATDRERSAKEQQIQIQSQHSTLELRVEDLQVQNGSLVEQLQKKEEIFGKKLEDKSARYQKLEKTVERLTGEVERLSNENDALSNELKTERSSFEVERRRISQSTLVETRENNLVMRPGHHPHHQRSSSMSTTASNITVGGGHNQNSQLRNAPRNDNSREQSPSEHSITSEEASYLDEVFDPNSGMLIGGNGNRSMTPKSFFESFSSVGLIENLQGQLRLRESEVTAFQEELSKNERIRKQLNEEIANLTIQNQQLALDMEKLGEMEQRLTELDKNYNAVLQMYGEKVEEADELRMDLDDVKEMYKAQIEQLLKKS